MAYYRDLREYLDALEAAGKLWRIKARINRDTELHPLVKWQFRGLDERDRAGWLFENVTDLHGRSYDASVASSIIAPSREVYALATKCRPDEIAERWSDAHDRPIEPEVVSSGPVKEVVHIGDSLLEHGGLDEFPIPIATNGWEGAPRLTALSWISRDPEAGWTNVGMYNGLQLGPLRTNCRVGPGKGLLLHWRTAKRRGEPLQVAAVIGAVPTVSMASSASVPHGLNELAVAGALAGEPLPVVRCETSDLLVPATAEIVLEGEIPTDYMEPDGASGEHTGHTLLPGDVLSFRITCITHRRSPIWHDMICQMPPSESSTIRAVSTEGRFLTLLRRHLGIPQVKDVAFHQCGAANRICVIQMREVGGQRPPEGVIWQALHGALSIQPHWPKIIIAVDEDIDPHDLESVFWGVSFRFQPHRDAKIVTGRSPWHDPSSMPWGEGSYQTAGYNGGREPEASAILIDATRKWAYTPVSLPKRPYMERARELWNELGLPALKPRDPWHGLELGAWPETYRRQAELAEKGEYAKVAEELIARGHPA